MLGTTTRPDEAEVGNPCASTGRRSTRCVTRKAGENDDRGGGERRSERRRWADRVLPRRGRGADLILRRVQYILRLLADRPNHVDRASANALGPAFSVFADLFAPVPDGEPSDERSEHESKHPAS